MPCARNLIVAALCLSFAPLSAATTEEITPLAGPRVHNWAELFVTADFLYWQARMDGLSYAQEGNYAFGGGPLPSSAHGGRFKNLDFGFEPGFRAGIGVDFRHDGWYLYSNYTWLQRFDAERSAHNNPGQRGQLVSTFMTTVTPGTPASLMALESAKAKWKLRFNAVDLELGRGFYLSHFLVFKPFIGMKYAWIDQKYKIFYTAFESTTTLGIREKQDFWGLGLRGGLNTEWHFKRNWSIYGSIAVSELYCLFVNKRRDTEGGATPGVAYFVKNNAHSIKPVLEMVAGVRYETFFCNDRYQLFFQAGWEEQIWFDQNQLIDDGVRYGRGDLVFQGLDIKAGFSF